MTNELAARATEIARAWQWTATSQEVAVSVLTGGLINATFRVALADDDKPIAVLQRLHPVFAASVNFDIDAVTTHLASRGMVTPRLLRTKDDEAWIVDDDGATWRALSWIDGATVQRVTSPEIARAAGELVGRFHQAMGDFQYEYVFARAGVHDTAAHLAKLRERSERLSDAPFVAEARALAAEILDAATACPPIGEQPHRHCHGDLKISNILFADSSATRAIALVDLDTVGVGTLAFELGDALRSWCNPAGEDLSATACSPDIFAAAMRGFFAGLGAVASTISSDERNSIVNGLQTVCIELAARFCVDVFDDNYFGWDASRFSSRREHNLVRARGQLALGRSVMAQRAALLAIIAAQ